ncbi:MliC family protein [Pasteurellaceae bacterium 22721_9_1]
MKPLLLLLAVGLSACTIHIEPIEVPKAKSKPTTLDKMAQKGTTDLYHCKNGKDVKVVRLTQSGKKSKKIKADSINLTFEGVTGKLNATLSQTGKSYTNIHWHWFEKSDNSNTLLNSVGQILAEECVKQQ